MGGPGGLGDQCGLDAPGNITGIASSIKASKTSHGPMGSIGHRAEAAGIALVIGYYFCSFLTRLLILIFINNIIK